MLLEVVLEGRALPHNQFLEFLWIKNIRVKTLLTLSHLVALGRLLIGSYNRGELRDFLFQVLALPADFKMLLHAREIIPQFLLVHLHCLLCHTGWTYLRTEIVQPFFFYIHLSLNSPQLVG